MPIQLDKILSDVAQEKVLHPNYTNGCKEDIDEAWQRVGEKNSLSVHEVRSIYKVLLKKYEQENAKPRSGWKLFPLMDELHQTSKLDVAEEDPLPMEEDEEYEMLEVQDDDEPPQGASTASVTSGHTHSSGGEASDGESPVKSMKTESSCSDSPERFEKQITVTTPATSTTTTSTSNPTTAPREEKKLLNSLISPNSRLHSSTAAALQKKGITMRKAAPSPKSHRVINSSLSQQNKTSSNNGHQLLAIGKTIQLPEALKRKLSEDQSSSAASSSKKQHLGPKISKPEGTTSKGTAAKTTSQSSGNEVENQETSSNSNAENANRDSPNTATASTYTTTSHHGINLITIPANDVSGSLVINGSSHTVAAEPSNGTSSPRIEDMDFRNEIIFETNIKSESLGSNGHEVSKFGKTNSVKEEKPPLDLGPVDNILPRTFFKNLCNSTRHESLGLYVANTLNRLHGRAAARLEMNILRAIINAQNECLGES